MNKHVFFLSIVLAVCLPSFLVSLYHEKTDGTVATESRETMIRVMDGDTVTQIALEDYILCVLLGEMPADFELEALKAQSVATRTYTLRRALYQRKHLNADVCTDASCCQAYISKDLYLRSNGSKENLAKMERAIKGTEGEVLTYNGNLIEATYFSCSGGKTEDAVAVWGTSVPYLKAVVSPGEENARHYEDVFTFSMDTFCRKLGLHQTSKITERDLIMSFTEGNGVKELRIGDNVFTGIQVRTLLSLPSTSFTISIEDSNVFITTKGYGHRVGMSQYGADAMAVAGNRYNEILAHYYPGTKIEKYMPM